MTAENAYTVAIFGIPDFERELVERIFSLSASRDNAYRIVDDNSTHLADIALVDESNSSAITKFRQLSAEREKFPSVIIVNGQANGQAPADGYWVKRPFTAMRVLGMLDKVVTNELGDAPARPAAAERPEHEPQQAPAADAASVKTKSATGNIYAALVVDDSLPVRKQVGVALRRSGISAEFAETGEAALELISKNTYDIIFLDVVLPGLDGYEICKTIKRDKNRKHTPVVMLTGKSSPFDKVKGRLSGCDTYLTKPVSLQEFNKTLNKWLNPPLDFQSLTGKT